MSCAGRRPSFAASGDSVPGAGRGEADRQVGGQGPQGRLEGGGVLVLLLEGRRGPQVEDVVAAVDRGVAGAGLGAALQAAMTPAAALAFLTAQMLFIPCVATVATIKQETKSWRWTIASVVLLLVVSFAMGILVYQVGIRF